MLSIFFILHTVVNRQYSWSQLLKFRLGLLNNENSPVSNSPPVHFLFLFMLGGFFSEFEIRWNCIFMHCKIKRTKNPCFPLHFHLRKKKNYTTLCVYRGVRKRQLSKFLGWRSSNWASANSQAAVFFRGTCFVDLITRPLGYLRCSPLDSS